MKQHKEQGFEELRKRIEAASPYGRAEPKPRKWMAVSEMGKLLGLKKTDRYWLIHKNYFRTENVMGILRVDIASFEKWYANQVKYRKVTGEEPGLELKESSLSPGDIADLLGVTTDTAYSIIRKNKLETVIVDYWKRVPKEVFWDWYYSQSRYRTKEDRERDAAVEAETLTMPEMAGLLGVTRQEIYSILRNEKYMHYFKFVMIADRKRIFRKGFEEFLAGQDQYQLKSSVGITGSVIAGVSELNDKATACGSGTEKKTISEKKYLTREEAAELAGVSKGAISKWYQEGEIPVIIIGKGIRITLKEFEQWLSKRKEEATASGND